MRLKISLWGNALALVIILYLLLNKETCPEVNERETTETTVVAPADSTEHTAIATVTVKKKPRTASRNNPLPALEDKPPTTEPADSNDNSFVVTDSLGISMRDSNVAIQVNAVGVIVGSPTITYKLLRPTRYDHYINTTEYISTEKWLRLYVGAGASFDNQGNTKLAIGGAAILPKIAIDYTYKPTGDEHTIKIYTPLFGGK